MSRKLKVKEEIREYRPVEDCHHFWIIESANGPKSRGVCKYCGERREFFNTIPDINSPKRKGSPLDLPMVEKVKLEKESNS